MNSTEDLSKIISLMIELADNVSVTASGYVVQNGSRKRVMEILEKLSDLSANAGKISSSLRYFVRRIKSDLNKGPVVSFDLWHDVIGDILDMTDR